jgi:hypothetical protein
MMLAAARPDIAELKRMDLYRTPQVSVTTSDHSLAAQLRHLGLIESQALPKHLVRVFA